MYYTSNFLVQGYLRRSSFFLCRPGLKMINMELIIIACFKVKDGENHMEAPKRPLVELNMVFCGYS